MKASLIITTYNWVEALAVVLKSIRELKELPYEVLIADDGSREETRKLIEEEQKNFPVPLMHIWHEDKGFRRSKILNKAIAQSRGDYLCFADGDIIFHPHFIKDHKMAAKKGYFTQGTRVILGEEVSREILNSKKYSFSLFQKGIKNRKNLIHNNFLSRLTRKTNKGPLEGIRGCNIAAFREDIVKVNGYNEDFEGWGREDSEFVARLMHRGIQRQNLKFAGIGLHIYHNEASRAQLEKNDLILNHCLQERVQYCPNGIKK